MGVLQGTLETDQKISQVIRYVSGRRIPPWAGTARLHAHHGPSRGTPPPRAHVRCSNARVGSAPPPSRKLAPRRAEPAVAPTPKSWRAQWEHMRVRVQLLGDPQAFLHSPQRFQRGTRGGAWGRTSSPARNVEFTPHIGPLTAPPAIRAAHRTTVPRGD